MKNQFYIQINSNALPHYIVSGCIRPVSLIENRESDIQNIFSDFVLLSSKKWSTKTDCSILVVLTDSELSLLKPVNDDYYVYDSIIPLSRVLKIYFNEKDKSETVLWNIDTGAGFVPDRLVFIEEKKSDEISNIEIFNNGISNDYFKLNQTYTRFNRIMGGFAFLRTALYDSKDLNINFPVNFFASIANYNSLLRKVCDDLKLKIPFSLNEILNNENQISKFIGKEITIELIQNISKKEGILIDNKFGNLQIDNISRDTLTFYLSVLYTYGKSKSKSVEDLIAVLFEDLEPTKREEIALIFGIHTGYESLRNYYKLKLRNFNVKFDFESKLDYYIVETLYQHSLHKNDSNFDFILNEHNFAKSHEKIGPDYVSYEIFDSKIITKRKDYLESLERILDEITGLISSWFPKSFFSINQQKMKSSLTMKVKQIYLDEINEIKNDLIKIEKEHAKPIFIEPKNTSNDKIESQTFHEEKSDILENPVQKDEIPPLGNDFVLRREELLKKTPADLRKTAKSIGIIGLEKEKSKDVIISKIIEAESSSAKLL